jgi:Bacterial TniB protein
MKHHLTDEARGALSLPTADRIAFARSPRWIGYPRAQEILDYLEFLLSHPPCHRMPGALLVSYTNNGKTHLVRHFMACHTSGYAPPGPSSVQPVIYVQAPPEPSERRLYAAIIEALGEPFAAADTSEERLFKAFRGIRQRGVRMLIIDEINHTVHGSYAKHRQYLSAIKYLGNELQISIVTVGTPEALTAIEVDPQLANRFEPLALPRWRMGEDFQRLLASFEAVLPLPERSHLGSPQVAELVYGLSEGIVGEVSALLERASEVAIRRSLPCVTLEVLESLRWRGPSARRAQVSGLL